MLVSLVLVMGTSTALASAASATTSGEISILASSGCLVTSNSSCQTGAISANSSGHFINWGVSTLGRGCHWVVRDVGNSVVVGSGNLGAFDDDNGRIPGLFSSYRMELTSCGFGNNGGINNVNNGG